MKINCIFQFSGFDLVRVHIFVFDRPSKKSDLKASGKETPRPNFLSGAL